MPMELTRDKKYFVTSVCAHGLLLLTFIIGFEFAPKQFVFKNTNQQDVISAIVLGDSSKSKILPEQKANPPPQVKPNEKPQQTAVKQVPEVAKPKDVVILKAEKKKVKENKHKEIFANDLLADLQKFKNKKPNVKPNKNQFQKLLQTQAEATLRQQLLNEDIKLKGKMSRLAQGEVDKYKALILQAISENWIVPVGANKNLTSELMIRLAPGGVVLDVQVTKSSGDPSLDSSVRAAVFKASPLPVPPESDRFETFRQFVLKVKPENVIDQTV